MQRKVQGYQIEDRAAHKQVLKAQLLKAKTTIKQYTKWTRQWLWCNFKEGLDVTSKVANIASSSVVGVASSGAKGVLMGVRSIVVAGVKKIFNRRQGAAGV